MSATFDFGSDYQKWLASQPQYKPLAEASQAGQSWNGAVQPLQGPQVGPASTFGGGGTWAQALANLTPGQATGTGQASTSGDWQRAAGSPFMYNAQEAPGSGSGGPPPTGPNGMAPAYSNPNNNPTTAPLPSTLTGFTNANNATSNALSNAINAGKPSVGAWAEAPEWTQGGGYNFGWDWKGGSNWVPRAGTVAAGTAVGPEVGWAGSKFTLPVAYTPTQDTAIWERNGQPQERSMERALRQASEMLRNGVTQDWNKALDFAMANISSEAARQGKSTGWDNNKFVTTTYGEKFNPLTDYSERAVLAAHANDPKKPAESIPGEQTVDPATGQPKPPAQTQTAGGLNAAQKQGLSDDPNQAYRYMMQQLGYNVDAPGMLSGYMKKRFAPLLQARLAAANVGDNGNYLDQIDQTINGFGGGLFDKNAGGNFYQNLRQTGEQAAQQGAGYLNTLKDQEQAQQYLSQLGVLRYAGSNPLIQQAQADQMERAGNQYKDLAFNNELQGKNIDPYQQWLAQQQQYRGLFGNF